MSTTARGVPHKVWVVALPLVIAVLAAWLFAKWRIPSQVGPERDRRAALVEQYEKDMAPAPGRASSVAVSDLIAYPEKYDGKRVILSGVWTWGFEHSSLDLQNSMQKFWIWVEPDWDKVNESLGDFSNRKSMEDELKPNQNGYVSIRIVAEGTFRFRSAEGLGGFGHMGVSEGLFHFDRLFEYEPLKDEEPNQPPQTTPVSAPR